MYLNDETRELAKDLIKFMQSKFDFDRIPRIKFIFNKQNSQKSLGMTGGYDHEGEEIVIYALDRHTKDILRSLAHEMMHHVQKCEGMMDEKDMSATVDPNYIMHDDFLKKVEADAFERGNICFREWEAGKKGDKTMNEAKIPKGKLSKYKKEVSKAGEMVKGDYPEDVKWKVASSIAKKAVNVDEVSYEKSKLKKPKLADRDKDGDISDWEKKVADKIESSKEKVEEVQVNEALKNSHNYNTITRATPKVANARDEFVYEELLRKFGIKK